jgi:glutamate--cysteine ligase
VHNSPPFYGLNLTKLCLRIPPVYRLAQQRLTRLINSAQQRLLKGSRIGLEKEALRVAPDGGIAQTPHPPVLGAPLTHPWITTDFSEALLEFITPPMREMGEALDFLSDANRFVYSRLNDEFLWATSMPCILTGADSVPIAEYGSSNLGRMKHVYRVGLGNRYGRVMQVIAGVHFNYSFHEAFWPVFQEQEFDSRPLKDFISESYFGLVRNLQRFGWLIPYLFGASPAVCKSFVGDQPTDMELFDPSTYYYPYATSLRMGDIGYQNSKEYESGFKACYDGLRAYVASLSYAIQTPCPRYEAIGVVVNGSYRQLNANILQIENEYYSTVRPKQPPFDNEKPTLALRDRGVQYVELRSLDVNPFDPLGIDIVQLRFLEALVIFCLLHESPPIDSHEVREIDRNQTSAAHRGREPGLLLHRGGKAISLQTWAQELCEAMEGICERLDQNTADAPYTAALRAQKEAIADPQRTPSARVLKEMRERGEGFHHFAKRISTQHARSFSSQPPSPHVSASFAAQAERSWERQREIEAADRLSFEAFLAGYFARS